MIGPHRFEPLEESGKIICAKCGRTSSYKMHEIFDSLTGKSYEKPVWKVVD